MNKKEIRLIKSNNYRTLSTDALVENIIENIGIPLPTYDYEKRKYKTVRPRNVKALDGVIVGGEEDNYHQSFKGGCIVIVERHYGVRK